MKMPRFGFYAVIAVGAVVAGLLTYHFVIKPRFLKPRIEQTLAIIKPDAVRAKNSGKIIDRIEQEGFTIIDLKKVQLDKEGAEKFYAVHKDKKFFGDLVNFMSNGPVIVMILEKESAVQAWRDLMGNATKEGSIRKLFGTNVQQNAVHGSDSYDNARREIKFFFADRFKN